MTLVRLYLVSLGQVLLAMLGGRLAMANSWLALLGILCLTIALCWAYTDGYDAGAKMSYEVWGPRPEGDSK